VGISQFSDQTCSNKYLLNEYKVLASGKCIAVQHENFQLSFIATINGNTGTMEVYTSGNCKGDVFETSEDYGTGCTPLGDGIYGKLTVASSGNAIRRNRTFLIRILAAVTVTIFILIHF
jgi:hypothetical protein